MDSQLCMENSECSVRVTRATHQKKLDSIALHIGDSVPVISEDNVLPTATEYHISST